MRSGCPGEVDTINGPLPGYGYWANAMTTRDTAKVSDPRDALRAVDIPMLIVRGTCDYIAPAVAEEYVEIFGAQFIAVKGAGHMLATERPEDLTALVADFLG
jgi:proline iminopeptidase